MVVAGGTAQVTPQTTTRVAGLDLAGNGLVDVTAGAVTITAGMSAAQLVAELLEGRSGGSWTGTSGITSTVAAANIASSIPRTVGWLDNGDGSLTAAYAAPGDTNLDWSVDILDVANFLALGKFDTGEAASWLEGDFRYDGIGYSYSSSLALHHSCKFQGRQGRLVRLASDGKDKLPPNFYKI